MKTIIRLASLGLLGVLAFAAPLAHAANFTWNNAGGGEWNDLNNWTPNTPPNTPGVPGINDIGIFNTTLSGPVTINAAASVKYFEFSGGASSVMIGTTDGPAITAGTSGNATVKNSVTGTNKSFIINAPLVLTPASSTASGQFKFDNQSTAVGVTNALIVNGAISSGPTSSTMNVILTGNSTAANTISGLISDGGAEGGLSVQKTTKGKWVLSNDGNTFTGGVSAEQGTLQITSLGNAGGPSALGANSTVKLGATAAVTLIYTGAGETSDKVLDLSGTGNVALYNSGTGDLTLTSNLAVSGSGAKTLTLRGDGTGANLTNTFAGHIADGTSAVISIDKRDGNTWILSGNNTYTGSTTVTAGTLEVGAGGTTGTLGSGAISINSNAHLIFNRSDALTVAGNITGAGSLLQTGGGTLTLSGANTYTGVTMVSGGTLLNNGSIAGDVSADAGILGGSGSFAGAVRIGSTATLAPGNSPGLLTFASTLMLEGTTLLQIDGTDRGTAYDALNVGGTLTYGGMLAIDFGSAIASDGSYALFSALDGSTAPLTTGSFMNVALTGSGYATTLTDNGGVWTALDVNGFNFSFNEATGVLSATAAAIPEPSTFAAIAGLFVLAGAAYRQRQRQR